MTVDVVHLSHTDFYLTVCCLVVYHTLYIPRLANRRHFETVCVFSLRLWHSVVCGLRPIWKRFSVLTRQLSSCDGERGSTLIWLTPDTHIHTQPPRPLRGFITVAQTSPLNALDCISLALQLYLSLLCNDDGL